MSRRRNAPADGVLEQPTHAAGCLGGNHIQGARYQMKKSHIAVILVFMSTGCASVRVGDLGHQRVVLPADPRAPNISIVTESDNKVSIVIDQEPIVLPRPSAAAIAGASTSTTTISWALPVFSN